MNTHKQDAPLPEERHSSGRPIWVRAPKGGQPEHYTGLSRGKLYALEAAGLVRTASLRPRGAVRGVKLFNLNSLLDYVESCASAEDRKVADNGNSDN